MLTHEELIQKYLELTTKKGTSIPISEGSAAQFRRYLIFKKIPFRIIPNASINWDRRTTTFILDSPNGNKPKDG